MSDDDQRYPIGAFKPLATVTAPDRSSMIRQIAAAPAALRQAVDKLSAAQLDTPYRSGGWTVRQVVHHLPDSHMNAYLRFKLALTEEEPSIRPYDEARWAELDEARTAPPEISLTLLEALHRRMVLMLESLPAAQFARTLKHQEYGLMDLDRLLGLYSWHGRHHVAQITSLRKRMNL